MNHKMLKFSGIFVMGFMGLLAGVSPCSGAQITYNINQSVGVGSVIGSITTDGTLGVLAGSDFLSFNLVANDGSTTLDFSPSNAGFDFINIFHSPSNTDVTATATELMFNFSGTDDGLLLFQIPTTGNGNPGICFETQFCTSNGPGIAIFLQGTTSSPQLYQPLTGMVVIGTASATPEPSTLSLLSLGVAFFAFVKFRSFIGNP